MAKKGYTSKVYGQKKDIRGTKFYKVKEVPRKLFSNAQLGWLTKKIYMFLAKKGYNSMAKGYSSTRIEKKGTPLGLGPKKDTQQLTYVVQN